MILTSTTLVTTVRLFLVPFNRFFPFLNIRVHIAVYCPKFICFLFVEDCDLFRIIGIKIEFDRINVRIPIIICTTIISAFSLAGYTLSASCTLPSINSAVTIITIPQIPRTDLPNIIFISALYQSLLRTYRSGMSAATMSTII